MSRPDRSGFYFPDQEFEWPRAAVVCLKHLSWQCTQALRMRPLHDFVQQDCRLHQAAIAALRVSAMQYRSCHRDAKSNVGRSRAGLGTDDQYAQC